MSNWKRAASLSDLVDDVYGTIIDGTPIAIYRLEDGIYATHNKCSHGNANLSEGFLDGDEIECPLHQGLFDVRSGEPTGLPCTVAIQTFRTELRGEEIFVEVTPD